MQWMSGVSEDFLCKGFALHVVHVAINGGVYGNMVFWGYIFVNPLNLNLSAFFFSLSLLPLNQPDIAYVSTLERTL